MAFRWNLASSLSLSIRTKILLVLVAVVVPAIVLYLVLAARVSFNDKTLLIYELNQSGVRTLGDSVESRLIRVIDKLKAIAKSPAQAQAWVSEDSEILRLKKFDSKSSQVV
ncbi:MAG: hypothetical protein HYX41_08085, partial [Bdellovibrio sp.]|nr:hypothetical protein [Bdellovibrio sp.]